MLTGMDHVDTVQYGDLDNLVDSEVGLNWCVLATLSNHVGLVRLCKDGSVSIGSLGTGTRGCVSTHSDDAC